MANEIEVPKQTYTSPENAHLASVRRRAQSYLSYLLWVLVVMCVLWALNTVSSLLDRWVALLYGLRRAVGFSAPTVGIDYWLLGGVAALVGGVVVLLSMLWLAYRRSWNRRMRRLWGGAPNPAHLRIRRLQRSADAAELQLRTRYVQTLSGCSEWQGMEFGKSDDPRQYYKDMAAAMLQSLEADILSRAVTVGLVVGLNRNSIIDSLSIAASALELQMHVLTRLGKRPSARTWIGMLKRTAASLFLNTYVTREDALLLNLTIRKAALGLEATSEGLEEAASALGDVEWDEVLGGISVPGLSAVTSLAGAGVGVGAFGLRQLGNFIEATANDLLQGVLAAGVLYYHGMALAADCLALDEEHRWAPQMNRSVGQAMTAACIPAGQLLRNQVREMRGALRERQRLALVAARNLAKAGFQKLRDASAEATRHFRRSPELGGN